MGCGGGRKCGRIWNARMQEEKMVEYNPLLLPHPLHHPLINCGRKGWEGEGKGLKGWRDAVIAGPPVPGPHSRNQAVQVAGMEAKSESRKPAEESSLIWIS